MGIRCLSVHIQKSVSPILPSIFLNWQALLNILDLSEVIETLCQFLSTDTYSYLRKHYVDVGIRTYIVHTVTFRFSILSTTLDWLTHSHWLTHSLTQVTHSRRLDSSTVSLSTRLTFCLIFQHSTPSDEHVLLCWGCGVSDRLYSPVI